MNFHIGLLAEISIQAWFTKKPMLWKIKLIFPCVKKQTLALAVSCVCVYVFMIATTISELSFIQDSYFSHSRISHMNFC